MVPSSNCPSAISIANPLSDPTWDAKAATFPDATPFHTKAWVRVIHDTYGFQPCYFVSGDSTAIQAIQPMMEVESWATRRRGIALPFTDECGLLARSSEAAQALEAAILEHARQRRWRYLEYRGDSPTLSSEPAESRFVRHLLDLRPGASVLHKNLESANRRAIRKAEKSGVVVSFHDAPEAMREFYTLQELTRRRHGIPPQPWDFFAAIQRHVISAGLGFIALAHLGGRAVAGAVFFTFNRVAVYKFGASDEQFQQARPNNLVMWKSIMRLCDGGFDRLHFGRTSRGQTGQRGFKLSWGTVESPLIYTTLDISSGHRLPDTPPMYSRFAPITRFVPLFVSRWLGAILYRHIA